MLRTPRKSHRLEPNPSARRQRRIRSGTSWATLERARYARTARHSAPFDDARRLCSRACPQCWRLPQPRPLANSALTPVPVRLRIFNRQNARRGEKEWGERGGLSLSRRRHTTSVCNRETVQAGESAGARRTNLAFSSDSFFWRFGVLAVSPPRSSTGTARTCEVRCWIAIAHSRSLTLGR